MSVPVASRRSIRSGLTRRLLLGMVAFGAVSGVALYVYLRQELYEEYNAALTTEARAIGGMLQAQQEDEDLSALIIRTFPRMHLGPEEKGYLQVWDQAGRVVIRSISLGRADLSPHVPQVTEQTGAVVDVPLPDGHGGRAITLRVERPIANDNQVAQGGPRYILMLAERRDELDGTLGHLAISLVLISAGLVTAAVLMVVYGVRRELEPLNAFSEQVSRVDAETLAYRFNEEPLPDELMPVARRLNDLLARLEASFSRERRFSANIAHELRTPLAELRTMVEVAVRWPPEPADVPQLHAHVLDVVERMSRLVHTLLSLIRVQQGRQSMDLASQPLAVIAQAAWMSQAQTAAERDVAWDVKIPQDATVHGDRTMLEAILTNLLANASSYARHGTTISCHWDQMTRTLRLANATDELHEEDLARVGEPFWRKDASRTGGKRLGLGLTLVRDYAAAMGMRCTFTMPRPGLFEVALRWPDRDDISHQDR